MLKCKGGYILIDCGGMDLTKGSTPQTITGLYKRLQTALYTNKPIVATNCVWGNGKPITPINVFAIQLETNIITATASTLQIIVTNEDSVTILNMAPSTEE